MTYKNLFGPGYMRENLSPVESAWLVQSDRTGHSVSFQLNNVIFELQKQTDPPLLCHIACPLK